MRARFVLLGLLVVLPGVLLGAAWAQDDDDPVLPPVMFDPSNCKPAAKTRASADADDAIPVTWKDFEITGQLVDPAPLVRELLAPTMNRHHALTTGARDSIEATAAAFGYHVVGLGTRDTAAGTMAHLHLAPLPMVRRVKVSMTAGWFTTQLDADVQRRMRVRPGTYLPWTPDERACELYEEERRIERYLRDEAFFDARAQITQRSDGGGVSLDVDVDRGPEYVVDTDRIFVEDADRLPPGITVEQIRAEFVERNCVIRGICFGYKRYTRASHEAAKQRVIDLFRKKGFPAVSVRITEPLPDRQTETIEFRVTIDPRRRVDVKFEGFHSVSEEELRRQLTFAEAASFDDFEKEASARALVDFLQTRGFFDARVTWYSPDTQSNPIYQPVVFQTVQGKQRVVRSVVFAGNRVIGADQLADAVATSPAKLSTSLLGTKAYATSAQLAADVERIVALYRRRGYRDARVRVRASTVPESLDSVALTAGLLSADRGGDLHVRFQIDEGLPTLLSEIRIDLGDQGDAITSPEQATLCAQVLRDLAEFYQHRPLAVAPTDRCVARAEELEYREDAIAETRDRLKDRLFSRARPRATVTHENLIIAPRRVAVAYQLRNIQPLRIGKIVIRGNFRTRDSIIARQLRLKEGAPLTSEAVTESTRRLRNTALFESVNIRWPDLESAASGEVNAVVEVTERYDFRARIDLEVGYSSFNGAFVKIVPAIKNLLGLGVSLDLAGTAGFDVGEAIDGNLEFRQLSLESTLRIPQWLIDDLFTTELTGFHRRQVTPRFGPLTTTGVTLDLSKTWARTRVGSRSARVITVGGHYDFRSRERNVDALRPSGANFDDPQVPITTRTGSLGLSFEWEQRVDRSGTLQPLAPEGGFRWEAQLAIYSPLLGGDDWFAKASLAGSRYWPLGPQLVLRSDLRYDHGFPLAGAALLPEVERFFGGGDSTVRGYQDDRLATEIVQVGVPPLDNVSQIRILPAGGNIRVIGSLDAQLRIYRLAYTALFFDAGVITNQWSTVGIDDIRPSVGMALVRLVTPFGTFAWERAVPLRPQLGDDPRGRWHISFAARAQF
jgi:outer membrane protein assembly factor BamA